MGQQRWTRRRSWGALIAGTAILGTIAGGWWWWRHRSPEGFIIDVRAVDDGSAVVVWRQNPDHGASREWIAHYDSTGNLDWNHELPGLTQIANATLVIGDLVSVRYSHGGDNGAVDHAVAAYALADGHLAWDVVLTSITQTPVDHGVSIPFFPAFSVGGRLVEQVIERGDHMSHTLYAIDPSSGQILGHAQVDASPEPVGPLVVGDRLLLHENGTNVNVVDTSHGVAVTDLHVGGGFRIGCVIGEDYIAVVRPDDRDASSLVAFHRGDPASPRVLAESFRPVDSESFVSRNCGRFHDRIVFAIVENSSRPRSKTSIAIAEPRGIVLATIAMPFSSSWLVDGLSRPPDVLAFSGALPRFVPYLAGDDTKEHDLHQYLAMVDLEQARIAWSASKALDSSDQIFHVGDRWYLNNAVSGGDVVVFDGTTGRLVAAVHGGVALEPRHVAGGKLWLYSRAWRRLDNAPLAALDAKTLAPLFARGINVTDVTRQLRDELGLP